MGHWSELILLRMKYNWIVFFRFLTKIVFIITQYSRYSYYLSVGA